MIHLHVHSNYSFFDGTISHEKLCGKAHALGMKSVAVTDHGNLHGAIGFYLTAKEHGIKPIIGCEVNVVDDHSIKEGNPAHLVLLAKNQIGIANLGKIVSIGRPEGFIAKQGLIGI